MILFARLLYCATQRLEQADTSVHRKYRRHPSVQRYFVLNDGKSTFQERFTFPPPIQTAVSGFVVNIGHDHENVPASVFAALLTSVCDFSKSRRVVRPSWNFFCSIAPNVFDA